MTLATYDDSMSMRDARRVYFAVNRFGEDGGYGDRWVDFHLGPLPMPFPNTPARVRAVGYHDLHHVLTGYDTDTLGELEISAWELGAGCRGFFAAWQLNLGGLAAGAFATPSRVFRAFVRGRGERSLYGEELEPLLDRTVGELRASHASGHRRPATAADVAWFALAVVAGTAVGLTTLAVILPLLPFGLVAGMIRKQSAVTS